MRRLLCVCAAITLMALAVRPRAAARLQADGDPTVLDDGAIVVRPLAAHDTHRYVVPMRAAEYVKVVVEQRGIDAVIQVRASDEQPVAEFQDEVGPTGEEQVEIAAESDGARTLVVRAAPGTVEPGTYAIRIAIRRASTDTDRSMQEARRLRFSAAWLAERSFLALARPLLARAVTLTELARGPNDDQVGAVRAELGTVEMDAPDFVRAEAEYRRAIAILERTRGTGSPAVAFVRSRLSIVYQMTGDRPKAESTLREAAQVIERTLGPRHLWYVRCLAAEATLRIDAGDLERASEILRRELAILEQIDYADTLTYAGVLNNLGGVQGRSQDYANAEDSLQRAIALAERLRGPNEYFLARPLLNLGVVARARKDYTTAKAYYLRALAIRQRIVGDDSPELSLILNNLANIYHATGDYTRALATHARALRIGEHAFGPYHQTTLLSVGNIARVNASLGDIPAAVAYERRADAIIETQLALNISVGSERQKHLFVRSIAERTDRTISLHLDLAPDDANAAALAALVLLQRKGRVLDALRDTVAVVRERTADRRDRGLFTTLTSTTAQLAQIALRAPDPDGAEQRDQAIHELEARKEQLEAALAERSAEFRAHARPVTVESVQAAIPDDAALLELTVFRPFDPTAERTAEAYGAPRYAAYIVRRSGTPQGVDLGDAAAIDADLAAFRAALRDPRRADVAEHARRVYARVMRPLAAACGDVQRLLIAPDGTLNLLPFEALVDEQGRYLVERYHVTYLTSGRDLLRMRLRRASGNPPVVIADPVFGEPAGTAPPATYFAPLSGSAAEARAIKTLFPDAMLFTGSRATKAAIRQTRAPVILHVASHGFFVPTGRDTLTAADSGTRAVSTTLQIDEPLLRSGVALAGANLIGHAQEDGILTALEASNLDLWGTKLVTLSACDTGVGEVRTGEGVYGLRRAFVLAGAESLVMSLWPVSDAAARDTMVAYYRGLRDGLGRGDALRQAKLTMLRRPDRRHPYYWASFIQSGEWASMNGKR